MAHDFDYDWIIIGSGFGGSVSACRLSEKGYSVAVLEQGRRYATKDLPTSTWQLRRYFWAPVLRFFGIFSMTVLRKLVVFHGVGVGGGSLVYANTLLRPLPPFYDDPQWAGLGDWKSELAPFYDRAETMLGAVTSPRIFETDEALREVLTELGTGDSFGPHKVGIHFGEPGKEIADPYFGGKGPTRTGCTYCGGCMVGCRVGAKNTLDKNYLHLAEKQGTEIIPETRVVDLRPIGAHGEDGWEVEVERSTAWFFKKRRVLRARSVIVSAGTLGTQRLLHACKQRGSLGRLSPRLGELVRTNSESIQGIRAPKDVGHGIAISSGGLTPGGTHIEVFRYGDRADSMSSLMTVHTGGGRLPRQLYYLAALVRHPLRALRFIVWPFGYSRRLVGILAMQPIDNSMQLKWRRRWWWPFSRALFGDWGDRARPPTYMPDAHAVTARMAEKLGGAAGSITPEVMLDTTTTAHILGGCSMGKDVQHGVIDSEHRVFGYNRLFVIDGSSISANLGVNPSLTITALAERAMARIPEKSSPFAGVASVRSEGRAPEASPQSGSVP